MQNQLIPTNWQLAKLGDISSDISYGYTASATSEPTGVRLLRITDIQNNTVNWPSVPSCEIAPEKIDKYQLKPRDLVFARTGATVGKSYLLKGEIPKAVYASYLIRVRCSEGISIKFLSSYFRSPYYWDQITDFSAGIGQPNVNGTKLKNLSVVIPPLAEQKVIADKLDTLLAQVENTKARLERIPQILKRFRQSVLAAAVSGRLTEEWRKGANAPQWIFVSLKEVAEIKDPHPSHRTPKRVENGIPYIGIGDLKSDGSIDFENARRVSEKVLSEHKERYQIKPGDFIFGKIGTLGKATILPNDRDYTLSANVILIQPQIEKVRSSFLMYFLSAPGTLEEIAKQANSTSQAAFGIKKMRAFVTSIPSLEEQTEIVRRVDQLFAHADRIEQQVDNALARVNNLAQSILAKAFRGELTEQWRKDNPELISGENSVEALLERIQAEHAAAGPAKKIRKRKATA